MAQKNEKLEQNQKEKPLSFLSVVALTGFIGGLFWSSLGFICYMFHFTKLDPRIIFEPWAVGDWKSTWLGIVLSIVAYGIVSIGVAYVYYAVLRRFKSMWVGVLYGLGLFLVVFLVLHPLFKSMNPLFETDANTLITSICLYSLYGLFVGYSISYEENELRKPHNKDKEQDSSSNEVST
ncbi:hypothetical protein Q73_09160 [Bacillus coahuilensis m2-6]|uniref:Membrane protein YqhR n=1 Tax=Bacillus coahuilensis p1.1.43 TaxID=1150625 RepID=A0A147K7Z4_9BACI|nr:YqhR family membrane protein [Bacillus coahuilensis]KUP06187.1 hypothetical protein Q75_09665 [Bacillus coahuilensis p1.1.43]KUP07377.1 hypothetical protein Q73_09160 [Bacillus coahuilensis m2-6]